MIPPTPPPDIDIEAWHESIDRIAAWQPRRLAMTHFGDSEDVDAQLERGRPPARCLGARTRGSEIGRIHRRRSQAEIAAGTEPEWTDAFRQAAPPISCTRGSRGIGENEQRPFHGGQSAGILSSMPQTSSCRESEDRAAGSAGCGGWSSSTTTSTRSTTSLRRWPASFRVSPRDGYRFADRIHNTGCAIVWSGPPRGRRGLLGAPRRRRADDGAARRVRPVQACGRSGPRVPGAVGSAFARWRSGLMRTTFQTTPSFSSSAIIRPVGSASRSQKRRPWNAEVGNAWWLWCHASPIESGASQNTLRDSSSMSNRLRPKKWHTELIDQVTWWSRNTRTKPPHRSAVSASPGRRRRSTRARTGSRSQAPPTPEQPVDGPHDAVLDQVGGEPLALGRARPSRTASRCGRARGP